MGKKNRINEAKTNQIFCNECLVAGWVAFSSSSSSSIFISFIHSKQPNVQIRFVPKFTISECKNKKKNKGGGLHELIRIKKIPSNDTKYAAIQDFSIGLNQCLH